MDAYSNGLTQYNNLLRAFNNPSMSQDDLEAFKIGQSLGTIGKNLYSSFNDTKKMTDGEDTELTDGINTLPGTNDIVNNLGTMDPKKIEELAQLYGKANL